MLCLPTQIRKSNASRHIARCCHHSSTSPNRFLIKIVNYCNNGENGFFKVDVPSHMPKIPFNWIDLLFEPVEMFEADLPYDVEQWLSDTEPPDGENICNRFTIFTELLLYRHDIVLGRQSIFRSSRVWNTYSSVAKCVPPRLDAIDSHRYIRR